MLPQQDLTTIKALPVVEESWVILLAPIIADANKEGWTVNLNTVTTDHSETRQTVGFSLIITDHEKNRFEMRGYAEAKRSEYHTSWNLIESTYQDGQVFPNGGNFEIAATGKKIYKLQYRMAHPEAAWNFFRSVQFHLTEMGALRKAYMKSQN
jgi:hypothetical protein